MTDWFRSWHGAPTDPKWLGIARRTGVPAGIVAAVAWALMDRASQADDRGSIDGYDADALASFFGCNAEEVEAIVVVMTDKGMVADGRLTAWETRQPKREDDSAARVTAHRERRRNAVKLDVTHGNAPDTEKSRGETEDTSSLRSDVVRARVREDNVLREEYNQFWQKFPHKVGKPRAFKAFVTARRTFGLATILSGLDRYVIEKPPDRQWLNPATFLNQERFNDEPAAIAKSTGNGRAEPAHDTLFRALAEVVEARAGVGERPAGADDGLLDE